MMSTIRSALLPSAAWLAVLPGLGAPVSSLDATIRLLGLAGVLGTLTVLIYRLGVWRHDLETTRHGVVGALQTHCAEVAARLEYIERHLEAIDHVLTAAAEQDARAARRWARTERWLAQLADAVRDAQMTLPQQARQDLG